MKVLLDSCVAKAAGDIVRAAGHDVVWAGDWVKDPGDQTSLASAAADGRALVTIDKDFGELVIVQGQIQIGLIRLVGFRASEQGPAIVRVLAAYQKELIDHAMLTVEPWRVRVRPA